MLHSTHTCATGALLCLLLTPPGGPAIIEPPAEEVAASDAGRARPASTAVAAAAVAGPLSLSPAGPSGLASGECRRILQSWLPCCCPDRAEAAAPVTLPAPADAAALSAAGAAGRACCSRCASSSSARSDVALASRPARAQCCSAAASRCCTGHSCWDCCQSSGAAEAATGSEAERSSCGPVASAATASGRLPAALLDPLVSEVADRMEAAEVVLREQQTAGSSPAIGAPAALHNSLHLPRGACN